MPTWLVNTDDMLTFWIGAGKQGLLWSRGKPHYIEEQVA